MSIAALLEEGLLRETAAVDVADLRDDGGARRISVRIADGWSFDVLPDRGLDIGAAWWRASPVAWRSPIEVDPGPGRGWSERFLGGLVVTCGPDHIGVAPDGSLHGAHSAALAHGVMWRRTRVGGDVGVEITGTIDDVRMFGRHVRIERTITAGTADERLVLRDRVTNLGLEPAPVALLYHVNLGAPAIVPGARVQIDAATTTARERTRSVPDATVLPRPIDHTEETVFSHEGVRGDDRGTARAVVTAPDRRATEVAWSAASLPRCYQWVLPTRGGWALGIEPSNAPLFGAEHEDERTRAVHLAPGEHLETAVSIAHREGPA